MKKLLVFVLAALLLIAFSGIAMAEVLERFRFTCTVEKYIEVNPNYGSSPIVISKTIPGSGSAGEPGFSGSSYTNMVDAVYANCPFRITYTGDNCAGDKYPILAKEENPTGRCDRLQTFIRIRNKINEGETDEENRRMKFLSGKPTGPGTPLAEWKLGPTITFNNTPHDGEVRVEVHFNAALPHKTPDFDDPDNEWWESADAGVYECTLTATYTALL